MMKVILFCIGVAVGMILMAYAAVRDRRELQREHAEAMRLAKQEIDDAESRIEELHKELIVKQNTLESQSARINRQRRIINNLKGND